MQPLIDLDIVAWDGAADSRVRSRATDALEGGQVVRFPRLAFALSAAEQPLLDPAVSDRRAKNITWFPDRRLLKGAASTADHRALEALLDRYATTARRFVEGLFPDYAEALAWGPTTLRPVEIAGRPARSWRRDDTRLHTDAFPSRPTRGTRILRIFSNVDPAGRPRVWRVGGSFEAFAAPRVATLRRLLPGEGWLLGTLGITGGRRSPYDQLMLQLHDCMKSDADYQRAGVADELAFPSGSSWMVFTDQVPHAAVAGRNALEQTFQLPVSALRFPERAPLRILERLCGERLAG